MSTSTRKTGPPATDGLESVVAGMLDGDPDRDQLLDVVAGFRRQTAEKLINRARVVLDGQRRAAARRAQQTDPDFYATRMALAGWQSLPATWPGAPIPPDMGLPRGRFRIDGDGILFDGQRVATPVAVADRDTGRYAVRNGDQWVTVQVPQGAAADAVTKAVIDAGVTLGGPIRMGDGEKADRLPAGRLLLLWLLGIDPYNGFAGTPWARFAGHAGEPPYGTTADKLALSESLTRTAGLR